MRSIFKLIIVVFIIGLGGVIAWRLVSTKPKAAHKPISVGAPLVEIMTVSPVYQQVEISAMGTVAPSRKMDVVPQVAGQIVEVNPKLIPGGRFRTGEILFRIDDRDYKIAVNQRKSEVTRALVELKQEKGRQAIARQEWKLLSKEIETTPEGEELALRKPQLENAVAALESAKSLLHKAELDVERTVIRAPFDALILDKFVDIGQYVTPGMKLASIVGSEEFWVKISVPTGRLPWISIPGINSEKGSSATVIQEGPEMKNLIQRKGRVVRLMGELDPAGRMARLLVAIEDPLGIHNGMDLKPASLSETVSSNDIVTGETNPESAQVPLLLGAYVNVNVQGPRLEHIYIVPRRAYRENDEVWTVSEDNRLEIKKVDIIWKRKDDILVRGLEEGDKIILSRIPTPVPGMELRTDT